MTDPIHRPTVPPTDTPFSKLFPTRHHLLGRTTEFAAEDADDDRSVLMHTPKLYRPFLCILSAFIAVLATSAALLSATPTAAAPVEEPAEQRLALTPPMGFNNWNAFHKDVSEKLIKETAWAMHTNGMQAAGYEYVNIDDAWMTRERDANGHLVPDPEKFPNGIKAVADYVHSLGLKLGIYADAGSETCAGFPGSYGHEAIDAQDFADWGVDYLKYDNCSIVPGTGDTQQQYIDRYSRMRDALRATGRPIVYSICEWGFSKPWEWGADVGHLWRTTGDISDSWDSMLDIFKRTAPLSAAAGPGGWNDPDMLEVGNGGMTDVEYRSHFSLWAAMAAPLIAGADLRTASKSTLDIYLNREVIAVDQDRLGRQGTIISNDNGHWVLAKPLASGDVAVTLFNETDTPAAIGTSADAVGLPDRPAYVLRDLWKHSNTETAGQIRANVPAHGTVMYRVSAGRDWAHHLPATTFTTSANAQAQSGGLPPARCMGCELVTPGQPVQIRAELGNAGRRPIKRTSVERNGPSSYTGLTYEAEAGGNRLSGTAGRSSCAECSGGAGVGGIGDGPDNGLSVNGVTALTAGRHEAIVYATSPTAGSFSLSVNGGPGVTVDVPAAPSRPVAVTVPVTLAQGENTLRFTRAEGAAPQFDRIVVGGASPLSGWKVSPTGPVTDRVLGTDAELRAAWSVTPPENAAAGTYVIDIRSRYTVGDRKFEVSEPVRLVVGDGTVRVSELPFISSTNGWGPVERDRSNGSKDGNDGGPLRINGGTYVSGLGTNAESTVEIDLAGACTSFRSDVGVDDETNGQGSVTFTVQADGRTVAETGIIRGGDAAQHLSADITGADKLTLIVGNAGDGNGNDHGDWAGVEMTCE
ncbi:NPCBM/NEW2 domain-containing protein [Streptomyces sp. NPDC057301]|uniref:NPCBM/NEW2 domain-containing protein n=1 Tax=Streptomyces sp. NPDC057301 TaxID=3346093 RepID=UPI003642B1B6